MPPAARTRQYKRWKNAYGLPINSVKLGEPDTDAKAIQNLPNGYKQAGIIVRIDQGRRRLLGWTDTHRKYYEFIEIDSPSFVSGTYG